MNEPDTKQPTRSEQWTANSANRRHQIIARGGRQLLVMVQPEDNKKLVEIILKRTKSDPTFSLTKWVAKMIQRDHSELNRVRRPSGKAGDPTD